MEEMITITQKEYNQLRKDSDWLYYLERAGVDNWDGYDYALELESKMKTSVLINASANRR